MGLLGNSLKRDLVEGRTAWNRGFLGDFWFVLCNSHPLLSIVLCHKDHPFSKKERLVVQFCTLSMSFFISSLVNDDAGEDGVDPIVGVLLGLPVMVFGAALKFAATCPCAQRGVCLPFRCFLEGIGAMFIAWGILIAIGLLVAGALVLDGNAELAAEDVVGDWGVAQVMSWVYALGIGMVMFMWKRRKEIKEHPKRAQKK